MLCPLGLEVIKLITRLKSAGMEFIILVNVKMSINCWHFNIY